ncbi:MAG: hypothetical protein ACRENN_04090 [Candidatus Eiseniibacteriota bacterium]
MRHRSGSRRARRGAVRTLACMGLLSIIVLTTGCSRKASPEERRAWDAELRQLQAEQDSLRARAMDIISTDSRIQSLPKDDVVISVPTSFLRTVVERVVSDVVGHITIRLSGIRAHVSKSVKKVVKIGEFTVDVEITEVVGKLRAGKPELTFGSDRILMNLPIEIAEGHGEAVIHFVWDGKNVADLACGDLDITQRVWGDVIPAKYEVKGALRLGIRGRQVVGKLEFPETKLRVRVKPSQESWNAINAILDEKKGVCGWVLDKVDVPKLLTNMTEVKGFNVKLPIDKIKPFVVPAGVRDSVTVTGKSLFVDAQTTLLRIDPDATWYGAGVAIKEIRLAAPPRVPRLNGDGR